MSEPETKSARAEQMTGLRSQLASLRDEWDRSFAPTTIPDEEDESTRAVAATSANYVVDYERRIVLTTSRFSKHSLR